MGYIILPIGPLSLGTCLQSNAFVLKIDRWNLELCILDLSRWIFLNGNRVLLASVVHQCCRESMRLTAQTSFSPC